MSTLSWRNAMDELCLEDDSKYHKAKMGNVIHKGNWDKNYPAQFIMSTREKLYIYGQSEQKNWFIREIFSNGSICDWVSSNGVWERFYPINFPYSINGRHYYHMASSDEKVYFNREILEDGKMGNSTDYNKTATFNIKIPFSIAGQQFYFGQNISNFEWFIRGLLPDGILGKLIQEGQWNAACKTVFILSMKDKPYIYCAGEDKWFICEILPNAKMGPQIDQGFWCYNFDISFSFSVRGRQYVYLFAKKSSFWVIRELLVGGKMGETTDNGYWEHKYDVVLPFSIKGKTYIYGNSFADNSWFIREIVIHC